MAFSFTASLHKYVASVVVVVVVGGGGDRTI
jgi:hypothetical protein